MSVVRGGEHYLNANAVRILKRYQDSYTKKGLDVSFSDIIVWKLANMEAKVDG